jgi:hypothetical protein
MDLFDLTQKQIATLIVATPCLAVVASWLVAGAAMWFCGARR